MDGCRVEHPMDDEPMAMRNAITEVFGQQIVTAKAPLLQSTKGRWPANVIHDGSEEVMAGFPETTTGNLNRANITAENQIYGKRPRELNELAPRRLRQRRPFLLLCKG